jgi:hypothetical protein
MPATLTTTRRDQLDTILEMSLALLDLARDRQWGALEVLDAQRRALVADCFRVPAQAGESDMMADFISRVLDVNQEISAVTEAARNEIGNRMREMDTGRRARQAYRQHY